MVYNFVNNILFGVQTEKFMKDEEFRLFFDDALLFLKEIIYFTPDLQRVVFKLCEKFEISSELSESFMNYPLLDKLMYGVGERFSEKLVQVLRF